MKMYQDFVSFFKGSKLFSTFCFGSLLMVIPFFGVAIVNGFQMQAVRNQLTGTAPTLPNFSGIQSWKKFFSNGIFTVFAIYLIAAPVALLTGLSLIADLLYGYAFIINIFQMIFGGGEPEIYLDRSTLWIVGGTLFVLNIVCGFLVSFVFTMIPSMIRRLADENSIWVAIDFPGHFVLAWKNFRRYAVTWLIVFTLLFFATTIAATISAPFTIVPIFGLIVFWLIYGSIRFGRRLIWASQLGRMPILQKSDPQIVKVRGLAFVALIYVSTFVAILGVTGITVGAGKVGEQIKAYANCQIFGGESCADNKQNKETVRLQNTFSSVSNLDLH